MATTGKIFQESSNIYQDEAKVLFSYYQQAADGRQRVRLLDFRDGAVIVALFDFCDELRTKP